MLPPRFPDFLSGPMAWKPDELKKHKYIFEFSADDVKEIDQTLIDFKALGLDGEHVSTKTFVLPTLRPRLEAFAFQIHHECGFVVLRGLDPKHHTKADNLVIFLGIASYIGQRRGRQDRKKNVLVHITDSRKSGHPRAQRNKARANTHLAFHTDCSASIIAFQVRQASSTGGETLLAPVWSIYNELAQQRPDLVRVLADPIWPAQIPRHPKESVRPILFSENNRVILSVDQGPMAKFPGDPTPGVASLSSNQFEALEALSSLAEKYHVKVPTRTGDMMFLNNLSIMHARNSFEDQEGSPRHLIRMWLHNDQLGWQIPQALQDTWELAYKEFGSELDELLFQWEPRTYYKAPRFAVGTGDAPPTPPPEPDSSTEDSNSK